LSSFAYLRALPVDYVKIDGAFVTDMVDDPSCVVMVRAISEVATGVGAHTIAEFVEDDRTLQWLRSLGVEYVQGYAIGRPSPLAGRERALVNATSAAL
jgi:EAL domain-containing protein (putative c-di-GMP-specific phosphodiesterase class I)